MIMGSFSLWHWMVLFAVIFIIYSAFRKRPNSPAKSTIGYAWPNLDTYEVGAVGESSYQAALHRLATIHGTHIRVEAVLYPELGNKHDRNAVRVDIGGEAVGYLSRSDAASFRRRLTRLGLNGPTKCGALIDGGFRLPEGGTAFYGVKLDIDPF
jgi:hypothetical protein